MVFYLRLFLLLFFIVRAQYSLGQDSVNHEPPKCKGKMLLGKWQLSKTFSMGAYHVVKKQDFNDVIQLKSHHRFTEEVFYENTHWILKGQWHFDSKDGTLSFTGRTYITGKLEDHPKDILLRIIQADKTLFAAKGVEKGQPVEVYYSRIYKR